MKYLAVLALFFLAGCATTSNSPILGHGSYRDYTYTDKDGQVMVHRVYTSGHQEWMNQAVASENMNR